MFQHNSHPCKTEASTTDMLCPHTASAMNRQLWLRKVLSAPGAEIPSQKKTCNSTFRSNRNPRFKTRDPPQTKIWSKTQPIPLHESPLLTHRQQQLLELSLQHSRRAIKHARHRLPGALRLLRPPQATLTTNSLHYRMAVGAQLCRTPPQAITFRCGFLPHRPCP